MVLSQSITTTGNTGWLFIDKFVESNSETKNSGPMNVMHRLSWFIYWYDTMFIDIAYGLFNLMCQIISIIRIDSLSILSNPQIS